MTMAAAVPALHRDRPHRPARERRVIFASSLGTVFEWYDFYLYGLPRADHQRHLLLAGVNETAALLFTLLGFAAGFAVRPFGALFFGSLGDLVGRKYTFLVTIPAWASSTFVVGLLPGYASVGWLAPVLFSPAACSRAWRWAASMAVRRPTSPSMRRRHRRGFYTIVDPDHGHGRPVPVAARHPGLCRSRCRRGSSPTGAGASRSWCRSSCWCFDLYPPAARRSRRLHPASRRRARARRRR